MTALINQSCRRRGCGHDSIIHESLTGRCYGVRVRGIPNSDDAWDEVCDCTRFSYVPAPYYEPLEIEIEKVHGKS